MNTALLRLLNIKPSEAWLVRNLFLVQLFQSIGIALLLTMANALFLAQFNVDELPKVYMFSAVVLLIVNYIYTKLEHHIQIQRLILYILLMSASTILIIRLLIYGVEYDYAPVVLLIWYQVIYLLCGNSFWALASLVFDVRESKRTFSILSAGDTPAKLMGYSITAFAASIGIKNFLFMSVVCFAISYLFMRNIIRSKKVDFNELARKASHKESVQALGAPGFIEIIKSFFGNNLILLIAVLSFIVAASLNVIDFTFLSEVKLKYHDDVQLVEFLGFFFAIGRVFAILAKITLTSRIERRLGIRRSLIIMPLLLIAFTIFILVSKQIEGNLTFYLYVFGGMVLMTEVLKSILQDPLVLVLFQPLKPIMRLKGHLVSKGIMAPLGLFVAGLFIYINIQTTGGLHIPKTCLLLLLLCSVWIVIVYLIDRQYVSTLIESLKTGFFRGNIPLTNDDAVKAQLLQKMKSPKSLEVIYAADTLEKLDAKTFSNAIAPLLDHENADIKKYALRKVKENKVMNAIPKVKELMNQNIPDELKVECVVTLSGLHEDYTSLLLEYLDHPHTGIQKEAMVSLFTSGDIQSIITAGQRLMKWMHSDSESDRILAAEIVGRVADKNFYSSLTRLLNDPSPAVEKQAIIAAGQIKNSKLIPMLLEKLNRLSTAKQVESALSSYGEEVLDYFPLPEAFQHMDRKITLHYINIAMRLRGEKSKSFLEKLLFENLSLKHEVIYAMKESNYSISSAMKEPLLQFVENEADNALQMMEHSSSLAGKKNTSILRDALTTELKASETSIFYLLSLIYDRQKILQAFENIKSGRKENIANAIEIIDLGVSKKVFVKFVAVIEYLHLNEPVLETTAPSADDVMELIKKIISNTAHSFNSWTRAAAMYTMNLINPGEAIGFLNNFPVNGEYLLEETRNFVLAKS